MLEILTNLWLYALLLFIIIIILILMKLQIIKPRDHETQLMDKAEHLIEKEKALKLKEKELHREIDNLYKDSMVVDNLREFVDQKHAKLKEYEHKVKTHDQELDEVKRVLRTVDALLERLPEKEIEKFVKSKQFKLYKEVIEKYVK